MADIHAAAAAMEQRGRALLAVRSALRHELDCLTPPPPELIAALRRPRGAPCLVRLAIYGRRARVVVHPIGGSSPIREAAVWQSITMYFRDRGMAA
ncbi:hypothetical protein OG884_06275 [Streptosporangium sp. NBC_01755]|uniref:hypothetical protein n=1 Tax=Streptosporangium sp. NBC_01755 TaxID=2975949 RepID=UPI002DDB484A|nr:hypothetical protein [Streptosporangium sp. NBC_01755]WSD01534.1 hypothetical protein OG884_06275 [Streptosporangium sp. NBC_01755]